MNNPVNAYDVDGRDAVKIVDQTNKTVTIHATYIYDVSKYNGSEITEVNSFLNSQNYSITEGDYSGFSLKFDLQAVPNQIDNNNINVFYDFSYKGVPSGNDITSQDESFSIGGVSFSSRRENGRTVQVGGVTVDKRHVFMNQSYDNLRNRIHEIFHTLFFNNDGAPTGIGSYERHDLPNQSDINKLINNPELQAR